MSLQALVINCTLKKSPEESNTEALIQDVVSIFNEQEDISTEIIRAVDYNIAFGMSPDEGDGDQWPDIFEKVRAADILLIGTPIWLGEKSSVATQVIERLYACSSMTNEKGQYLYYNKVGGVIVTGNEDGAKEASRSVLYALSHIGFTLPPNVDTYWVGEAGPGPSYIEAHGERNDFTRQHGRIMAYNLMHFARLLRNNPIPAQGNVVE
ncbi:flavodoxin family protein [Aneurinibacillus sp. REN35]|uniref:flavodoxin family protein n=1 Tax=Aneurinibacillus sp. REN35 TaxID=3237286 RepID=UPI003529759B